MPCHIDTEKAMSSHKVRTNTNVNGEALNKPFANVRLGVHLDISTLCFWTTNHLQAFHAYRI